MKLLTLYKIPDPKKTIPCVVALPHLGHWEVFPVPGETLLGIDWVSSKLTTSRIQTLKTQIHLTDILKELRRKMLYIMEHITYRGVYINNNYLYIYIIYIFSIL